MPEPADMARWRARHLAQQARLAREAVSGPLLDEVPQDAALRRARVQAAIERVRALRPTGVAGISGDTRRKGV